MNIKLFVFDAIAHKKRAKKSVFDTDSNQLFPFTCASRLGAVLCFSFEKKAVETENAQLLAQQCSANSAKLKCLHQTQLITLRFSESVNYLPFDVKDERKI